MSKQLISRNEFDKGIIKLLLRGNLTAFPKKEKDQYILLKSIVLHIGKTAEMSEKEVNEKLIDWTKNIARSRSLDHITLRRNLVDMGYLIRSSDGRKYYIFPAVSTPWEFEASVEEADVLDLLNTAHKAIEERKKAYLAKAQKE